MTDISTYKLDAAFTSLAEFDHCAKPDDFIEVSLWHNAEGFNVDLSSNRAAATAIGAQELFHPDSKRTEGVKWCVKNIYAIADELENQ